MPENVTKLTFFEGTEVVVEYEYIKRSCRLLLFFWLEFLTDTVLTGIRISVLSIKFSMKMNIFESFNSSLKSLINYTEI